MTTLASLGATMVVTAEDNVQHYLGRIDRDRDVVVIADSTSALQTAQKAAAESSLGATFCLLVVPTTYSHWGKFTSDWAKGLSSTIGDDTVYLTDSELSRTVLESHLSSARVDVRVLHPAREAVLADAMGRTDAGIADPLQVAIARFEAMKRWGPGEDLPQHSGVEWTFDETDVPLDAPALEVSAAEAAANAETLARILRVRTLEGSPLRISVLGHKLSFIDELARDLAHSSGSRVVLDEWKHLGAPDDAAATRKIMEQSEVVIGEWGRPNNVWIQQNAAADKRLIVRVHRYEVTTDFPAAIDMERFSAGVVIVPWVGRALVQKFGWPAEKLVYIPNYVNGAHFRRPKLPGAEFTLGIVGITPDLKRLDLALDLLALLRAEDPRFTLRVRGQLPPEHIHWTTNPAIADQWGSIRFRLRQDPLLRTGVFFDDPGRDMASWLEGIGVILSTSDLEGSHVALAEGMASGALPIARPWPGVRTLWPQDSVFDTLEDAAEQVLRSRDPQWRKETIDHFVRHPALDQDRVLRAWWDLVQGDLEAAQNAFRPVDWNAPWYEPVELD
ncbi:hypothetical protein ACXET9_09335 [Brachybacterium sp. DNPG3]